MIYLEDYLEMIEHLPQELRDRFTEMREMDLAVQNNVDSLDRRVKLFFSNAKKMKATEKEAEYRQILKDYYKTLEDADEKVHLANQIHELVERYLRKLDQELHKFKMELEADHRGITEILEKRSLELDQPQQNGAQKENRYSFGTARSTAYCGEKRRESSFVHIPEKRPCVEKQLNVPEPRPTSAGSGRITPSTVPANTTNVAYNLGHIGAGGNAIAAAVSQAIAATQQMQQGRRTASLKASYEAINIGVHAHEFSIGKELAAIQEATKKQKNRKASTIVGPSANTTLEAAPATSVRSPPPIEEVDAVTEITATTTIDNSSDNPDWTYDPNEPRYCICNQVSYGYMVECDNENCPFEWFHFACVDIKAPPKGKWYCPQCTSSMKRRGGRKN